MARKKKGIVIAVDLGTETTLLARTTKNGQVEVIPDPDGNECTVTAIGLEGGDPKTLLYGRAAKSYRKIHPEHVCVIAKRARGHGDVPGIVDAEGRSWTTEELEAEFLAWRLKHAAEYVGESIAGVLVTVPAAFNDAQRRATQGIVEQAGYKYVGIVNEPTAALLRYTEEKEGTYIVADIGGGTFDVNVLRVEKGKRYTTLATEGQDDLGGREYTLALVQACIDKAAAEGIALDPAGDVRDMVAIELACEEAKRELTHSTQALISFRAKDRMLDLEIARDGFEDLVAPLNERILSCFQGALEQAGLQAADLDGVVFVGGGSRVPSARRAIEGLVGADKLCRDIDPDRAVVTGACRAVGMKLEERRQAGDAELVESVSPYVLKGDIALQEIMANALGVGAIRKSTGEHILVPIVERGTQLPASANKDFGLSNGELDDVKASITILEGEAHAAVGACDSLASFSLEGMPAGPTENRIRVTFGVDVNGLVDVHALDTHSGKELHEKVDAAAALSKSA
jgi:molecular chaperone DnaK